MITVEDWAEIRRLHRAEGVPIKQIARRLGVARNTVRSALASDRPPEYHRDGPGSIADGVAPAVEALLAQWPQMPATVIARRIGWDRSMTVLRGLVRQLRPLYLGLDPADRVVFGPGDVAECDLWFPKARVPVGPGGGRPLPVLVMVSCYSRMMGAVMIPSRQAGDILGGMWEIILRAGRVARTLVWDREAAIGGGGKPTVPVQAFCGTLATQVRLAPARDPEFKGMVERDNQYLATSFLPGRRFTSPEDFNAQLAEWIGQVANQRVIRRIGARPVDLWDQDTEQMIPLPPTCPKTGLETQVRLGRDYYIRIDSNDYSVHPQAIGRIVKATASLDRVLVHLGDQTVADHPRCWGKAQTITDPTHRQAAKRLRQQTWQLRHQLAERHDPHAIAGQPVPTRPLAVYDQLFGVNFLQEQAR